VTGMETKGPRRELTAFDRIDFILQVIELAPVIPLRPALRGLLVHAVLAPVALLAAGPAAPLRALLVTGGCCHDYQNQKTILSQGISARANVSWTIVHEGADRDYMVSIYTNANWAAGYDVVVHNECFGFVTNNAFIERIAAAHYAGVPAVMLHCSTHSYRTATTDEWRKCLGISSYSHEALRALQVTNLRPTHPITRGFPQNWSAPADELYKLEVLWPNVVPLAQSYGQETMINHVNVWANTYGSGRIFGTTLGHANTTVGHPTYLDLITRGLLWACGRLDDTSAFRMTGVRQVTNTVWVTWESVPGWSYSAEASPTVSGPWGLLPGGPMTATNVTSTVSIPMSDAQQRFIRVHLVQP